MNKVYWARLGNIPEQITNKTFAVKNDEDKKLFNGIDVGDYALVPLSEGVTELWKASNWENDKKLNFDVVATLDSIDMSKLVSLKLFKVNLNLLVNAVRQGNGKNKCFVELQPMNHDVLNIISDKNEFEAYLKEENNYRKLCVVENNKIDVNSENVQIYKDGNEYHIYEASFIDEEVLKRFDGKNYENGKTAGQIKGKLYKLLEQGKKEIDRNMVALNGFYDLFCSGNTGSAKQQKNILKSTQQDDTKKEQKLSDELKKYLGQNVIFYGVPGCGKSHYVNELLAGVDDNCKMRVLFHPEYGYSDFVGQVMPVVQENKGDKIIDYEFVQGPFVEILKKAYENREHEHFLIIEEINRGNAPAIFGDIFQLLDRDENGKSEYGIYNKNISDELKKKISYDNDEIYIPRNLTILATMNTCDQNVFTLDTAFKRRWRMTRIENDLNNASTNQIGGMNFSWREFVKALNADILTKCNEGMLAEDKLLGAYFVKESEIADARVFAEKIFMYLWNDVVKYNKEQLFRADLKTLDDVIKKFIKGYNVFNDNCGNLASLYNPTDNAGENDQGN